MRACGRKVERARARDGGRLYMAASSVSASVALWFWQAGHAPDFTWTPFSAAQSEALELAKSRGVARVHIDSTRQVCLSSMRQLRTDDATKSRAVKRELLQTAAAASDASPSKANVSAVSPSKSSPKRKRIVPTSATHIFTPADADDIADRLADPLLSKEGQHGVNLLPVDAPTVERFAHARQRLASWPHDLSHLGFRLFPPDESVLSAAQAQELLEFCRTIRWEPRRGSNGRELPGTERKNFGVTMDDSYRVVGTPTALPPLLEALGERVRSACRALTWRHSKARDQLAVPKFEQAYVQTYPPGGSATASTLGFHFDHRSGYGELICGVTLCGSGKLLLAGTNGNEFVEDPNKEMRKANVRVVPLEARSAYALSGMARYDLRHAVVNDSAETRISVTFRSVNWAKARRGR